MKQVIITLLIAFLISFLFLASWQDVVAQRGYALGFDIFIRWEATQAFWQGQSPYSDEVTEQSDIAIYGRPRQTDEIAYAFYDPAYATVVLAPLAIIPLKWAGVVWSAFGFSILITLVLYWSLGLQPRLKPLMWGIVIISTLMYRPALMTMFNGQYSLFLLGCAILAWRLIVNRQDIPAGLVLAISTIKPSIFLFVPLIIMLWALRWQRWRLLISFVVTLITLGVVTVVQIGWWIPDFLSSLNVYSQDLTNQLEFSWSSKDILSPLGLVWLGQCIILLIIGLRCLWLEDKFPWYACIAMLNLNLIFAPHIVEYDLGILLILLFWLGTQWASEKWGIPMFLFLIWFPWVSWFVVLGLGGSTLQWQNIIWQVFPNVLLVCIWVWLRMKKQLLWSVEIIN